MIAKRCAAPKGGGSARGGVRYILGYAVGEKNGDERAQNRAFWAMMDESRDRSDLGVGAVWKPAVGDGKRPSAIYARGVLSLATADLEMQAWYSANGYTGPRDNPAAAVHHDVFSVNARESKNISDEQLVKAVLSAYDAAGLGDCPLVIAVHRDTDNAHAHVVRAAVDPLTMRRYDQTQINHRLDFGCRTAELEHGMEHDRGLVVVDRNESGSAYLRDSTYEERKAWRRETRQERLVEFATRRFEAVEAREGSFSRYTDASVEPRMREALRQAEDAEETPFAIDVHNAAAYRSSKIEIVGEGEDAKAYLRNVSLADFKQKQRAERETFETELSDALAGRRMNSEEADERRSAFGEKQREALHAEWERINREGELVPLSPQMTKQLGNLDAFRDVEEAEEAFAGQIESDPGRVARDLTRQQSVFTRDDMERYLSSRLSDNGEIARLLTHVQNNDSELVMQSPDVADGIFTTKAMLALEAEFTQNARALATTRDTQFDDAALQRAIGRVEREKEEESGNLFAFTDDQKDLLSHLDHQLSVGSGVAGSGKTTVMRAVRYYAEEQGRPIIGLTIAEAAAIRLEGETGIPSMNVTLALTYESKVNKEIISRGAIVILDESGMVDTRQANELAKLCLERDATLMVIGGPTQLTAIGAGDAHGMLEREARAAGTAGELSVIYRQQNDWHKDSVYAMEAGIGVYSAEQIAFCAERVANNERLSFRDEAIRDALSTYPHAEKDLSRPDSGTVRDLNEITQYQQIAKAVDLWEKNGALKMSSTRDDAIQDSVAWYMDLRANDHKDVLLVAFDHDTVRHLNEEIRRQVGLEGNGHTYFTEGGNRQVTDGDRIIFGLNDRKLGVYNGNTGTVVGHGQYKLSVALDNGTTVSFDTRRYLDWDHGYASTVHKAQGATVYGCGGVGGRELTAELAHVIMSRSTHEGALFVPHEQFSSSSDVAEHLASRVMDKITTQDLEPMLSQRGGPDTYYAMNGRAQAASSRNPDVIAYEHAQAEKGALRQAAHEEISNRYKVERANTPREEWSEINKRQQAEYKTLMKELGPDDKAQWLKEHRAENNENQVPTPYSHDRNQDRALGRDKGGIETLLPQRNEAERDRSQTIDI